MHTGCAILSTAISLLFAIICNFIILKKYAKFKFSDTWLHFAKIFLYGLIMMVVVELTYFLIQLVVPVESKFGSLIIVTCGVTVGILVYGGITMKTRLADQFLGDIPNKVRRKLGLMK